MFNKSMYLTEKLNRGKRLFFKPEFSNLVANKGYRSSRKIQYFNSVSDIMKARPYKTQGQGF